MKFGIIKERKNPPDRRVVLSPSACKKLLKKHKELSIKVESSKDRFFTDEDYKKELDSVKPLNELIKKYQPETSKEDTHFIKEFVLWALVEYKKLSKDRFVEGFQFSDLFTR